ncbi:MAG: hypothetical protein BroJett013_25450 [Alphaproteobacteria bacterium]|nr:MAG: hypothetical protein BroJett013_25450 [Alphaproteobacteria bacterium]
MAGLIELHVRPHRIVPIEDAPAVFCLRSGSGRARRTQPIAAYPDYDERCGDGDEPRVAA